MNEGELDGREALCGQLWYMHCRMDRQASRNCKAGRSLPRHVPIWPAVWHVTILHGGSSSYRLRPAVTVNSMLFFPLWLFLYCRCWVPSRVNSGGWWMTKVPFPRVCLKSLTLTLQRLTPMRCCHMWTRKLQSYALTISPHSSKITLAILPIFKCVPSLHQVSVFYRIAFQPRRNPVILQVISFFSAVGDIIFQKCGLMGWQ